jgi:hypothetical protein
MMLKLAAEHQDLLRSVNIDPEEVEEIQWTHEAPHHLKVKFRPKTVLVPVCITKRETGLVIDDGTQ